VAGRHVVNERILYCWAKLNLFLEERKCNQLQGFTGSTKPDTKTPAMKL